MRFWFWLWGCEKLTQYVFVLFLQRCIMFSRFFYLFLFFKEMRGKRLVLKGGGESAGQEPSFPSGLRKTHEDGLSFKSCSRGKKMCSGICYIMVLCGLPPSPKTTTISWCWKKLLLNVYSNHVFLKYLNSMKEYNKVIPLLPSPCKAPPQEWDQWVTSLGTFKNGQSKYFQEWEWSIHFFFNFGKNYTIYNSRETSILRPPM